MRDLATKWGRARWPGCRVVHELVVNECRIDMAFIQKDHIAGLELKSSRDVLDRLENQVKTFSAVLPELWVGIAPKWCDEVSAHTRYQTGLVCFDVENGETRSACPYRNHAEVDRTITVPLIDLLWRDETASIAHRMCVPIKKREAMCRIVPLLVRKLTGDEIVREVCRELRGRNAFPERPKSDAPILEAA